VRRRNGAGPPPAAVPLDRRPAPRTAQVRHGRRHHLGDRHRGVPRPEEHRAGGEAAHRQGHRGAGGHDRVLRAEPRVVLPHPRRPGAPPRGRAVLPRQRRRRGRLQRPAGRVALRAAPVGARGEPVLAGGGRLRVRPDRRRAAGHGLPLVGVPPVRLPGRERAAAGARHAL
ncbi:MAG: FIG00821069: hypothetical protein, partial [uncultured Pseudonocardia sp.]